ncbi:MAG: hypothetical protein KME28_09680 [Pelatocladus maniniholoensis HA4357-MV3]|uniref:Uncharacterized protein n=1 Tax=Pelatocladus maniniholoensis HA4357-MV3 TaxID=1117104 RepID=A0A9E3H7W6_9NOST|nr:hypothetical protein [Pelatocladus maniniholoensis HA4357-MV3]
MLGGDFNIDKAALARHLAWCFSNKQSTSNNPLPVKEWYRSSEPQSIDLELQKAEKTTVFILTQVSPQNIGYDLSRIQSVACDRHYVIVSTDLPFDSWQVHSNTRRAFCYELSIEEIADSQDLINKFTQEDEESLSNWYYHQLNPREQLLALGLCFFDGLFDDQFFAALEQVVQSTWQKGDPSLRAFDYCDLNNLRNFFNFVETKSQGTKVEIRFPKHRQMLLKEAWNNYGRRILAVLPVLSSLVENSVKYFARELYGSAARRNQLRRVIGETISEIGSISSDAVEDTLINLAANDQIQIQAVAARSMALWRTSSNEQGNTVIQNAENDQKLFKILQNWQKDARFVSQIQNLFSDRDEQKSKNPYDYIRATIALTVSYAALYDQPNELHQELYKLLKELVDDPNQLVLERLSEHTLPIVIQLHLNQLESILCEIAQRADGYLSWGISSGLALTYQAQPDEVLRILQKWQNFNEHNFLAHEDKQKITPQQSLLGTVTLTYGKIQYKAGTKQLTIQKAFQRLEIFFNQETKCFQRLEIFFNQETKYVRQCVLIAIRMMIIQSLNDIEEQLKEFVSKLTIEERGIIIEEFTRLYLNQRKELKNGDNEVEVKGLRYQIWIDAKNRPNTAVENTMLSWLKDDTYAIAQQMAVQALLCFACELDQYEERRIRELEGKSTREISSVEISYIATKPIDSNFYLGQLIPLLTTITKGSDRKTVCNLLPIIYTYNRSHKRLMQLVLDSWCNITDNKIKEISNLLKRGIEKANNFPKVIVLFGCGVLLVPFVAGFVITAINNYNISIDRSSEEWENGVITATNTKRQFASYQFPKPYTRTSKGSGHFSQNAQFGDQKYVLSSWNDDFATIPQSKQEALQSYEEVMSYVFENKGWKKGNLQIKRTEVDINQANSGTFYEALYTITAYDRIYLCRINTFLNENFNDKAATNLLCASSTPDKFEIEKTELARFIDSFQAL